ncbi:alpha/beta hydrolase [Aquimarina sp. I32.4]|uniref:alpha/beta hydrolase n=1 Tax=Aquimarina sp. I32.4 TaxID=2053903 RepID=UPI000CDF263A|nr:alpha/beta hydrolase [Aquimarina sp. I32.4]
MRFSYLIFIILLLNSNISLGQDIYRKVEEGKLYGRIDLSEKHQKNKTLIVFIPGSGPIDSNGNSMYLKTNNFKLLSNKLLDIGYSTFRFDKRGIANSRLKEFDEKKITIDILVKDIIDWIYYIRKNYQFKKVYLLGHSEGSLIAGLVSKKIKVSGVISIAGSGRRSNYILKDQFSQLHDTISSKAIAIIDSLSANKEVKNIPFFLHSVFRPSVQPYLLSWFKYNPAEIYDSIKASSIIIHGDSDLQISSKESIVLSKNKIKRVIIPKMNHLMKEVDNDYENRDSYVNFNYSIPSKLVFEISNFIKNSIVMN